MAIVGETNFEETTLRARQVCFYWLALNLDIVSYCVSIISNCVNRCSNCEILVMVSFDATVSKLDEDYIYMM